MLWLKRNVCTAGARRGASKPPLRFRAAVATNMNMTTSDEKGVDEQILAVALDDPRYHIITDLSDLQEHWPHHEVAAFFRTY